MTKTPALTIGMAHHTDYDGVYFTIQHLRSVHREAMRDVEIVVVDNSFGTKHSQMLGWFLQTDLLGQKYDPMAGDWIGDYDPGEIGLGGLQRVVCDSAEGTAAPRDRIFEVARAPAVLVIDCHVLIDQGAVANLAKMMVSENRRDLYSGPARGDRLGPRDFATHLNGIWSDGFYGKWGQAWRCECLNPARLLDVEEGLVSPLDDRTSPVKFVDLKDPFEFVEACPRCKKPIPEIRDYEDRRRVMLENGWDVHGAFDSDSAFSIPACGLGLFACRKDQWPGFHPYAYGWGGEEFYIHRKVRQAGRHAVCLPWLKWIHRSRRTAVEFTDDPYHRVRNYVLGWQEIGADVAEIQEHFRIPDAQWRRILADPEEHTHAV